jgi:hypothetical protein
MSSKIKLALNPFIIIKYLSLLLMFALPGCGGGSEADANGFNIKDIGFITNTQVGSRSAEVPCQSDETAISVGCSCGMNLIHEQYIDGNTAYCTCDGSGYMSVSVICANIKY